ncbi:tetratricopeptide repeat protein [Mucilaginibacter terrenus]|uniref:Tetratricopeptide repeat protein n=1 Tax=Mucilaginibacter terrenus TaxID=2482727 RepID=A0A3E2NKB9_9SPHI|nr:tetratricopeptide repeat protein [Mucilaginibacter terrenus]RFZ81391.1 tetratricopeptide repeat protein [Mucilaginibacter terrenus]
MNKKQIVVSAIVVATMGYLYVLPVKGLVKPKETSNSTAGVAPAQQQAANVTEEAAAALAKPGLSQEQLQQINTLEEKLKAAGEADKPALQRQLATLWDQAQQPAPAAFYYQSLARKNNEFADWINTGNRFNEATKATEDQAQQAGLAANAAEAFQIATKQKPDDLEAKTGLGVALVNGGGMPMQGITLLLDVVKQDPKNHAALLNLGMFAMKSGQYDKAVGRFKTMLQTKEEVEPLFYLAESYKQLGQKQDAIEAYERCKKLMDDPVAGQRIDEYIKELKK